MFLILSQFLLKFLDLVLQLGKSITDLLLIENLLADVHPPLIHLLQAGLLMTGQFLLQL